MFLKLCSIFLLCTSLYANKELSKEYYTNSLEIKLSSIIETPKKDVILFNIDSNKHSKRIESLRLLRVLKELGYPNYTSKFRYIKFSKKSTVDTQKIENALQKFYQEHYKTIQITKVHIHPRSYIEKLPNHYTIKFNKKAYLQNKSTLSIQSTNRKQLFFDYTIEATISVYIAKKDIKRESELNSLNSRKKSIMLQKFRAMPLEELQASRLQSKNQIRKDAVITQRDVRALYLVKRGSRVNVTLSNSNMSISFVAKALNNGSLGDNITILKSNGKKMKAQVTARNNAEIR